MNYNLKKANIPKDSISNLNDNDMLECGNECILNFDNLSWKGKTSPYINSEYITLKKQQSVPSNYQYLKLSIISSILNSSNASQVSLLQLRCPV